jgi:hypothetical protein
MKQHITGLVALVFALGAIGLHFWERPVKIAYAETSILLKEFSEAVQTTQRNSQRLADRKLMADALKPIR